VRRRELDFLRGQDNASVMRSLHDLAAALMLVGLASACGGASSAAPGSTSPASSAPAPKASSPTDRAASGIKAAGDAKVGDRTTCPTSGEEFVVTADSPKFDYKGKTYYFCCGGCDSKFANDPEKYLNKKPDA
jgi:YHS domain-containing protein